MKQVIAMGMVFGVLAMAGAQARAEDPYSAEQKAEQMHAHASSDVIYSEDEMKAIYYQNVVIIDLLKQIRDLLDARLKPEKQ